MGLRSDVEEEFGRSYLGDKHSSEIYIDKETGVNYLIVKEYGKPIGVVPRYDSTGNIIVNNANSEKNERHTYRRINGSTRREIGYI